MHKMDDKKLTKSSKFLSLVLRHKPETIGLELDSEGWADVSTLLKLMKNKGKELSRNDLQRVVDENNKKRFTFNDNGTKIRANQGHSISLLEVVLFRDSVTLLINFLFQD